MLALLQKTWETIQTTLQERAGTAAFESWLQDLRPMGLERGVCHLEAPNRMCCERVQRLFVPLLEEMLSDEIGTRISVSVTPKPDSLPVQELEVGPSRPVIDASNRTTFLVLKALIEERDLPAKLFFVHGPAGTGKTFLLRWYKLSSPARPILYDAHKLLGLIQIKVRDGEMEQLRAEMQKQRPLIIDGVHRFARHQRAQRELLHILQHRLQQDAPTLLSSRWHPRDIWALDPGLCSMFMSGFVTVLNAPGPNARLQYLRALSGAAGRNGQAQTVERLAAEVDGGYQDLKRAWSLHQNGMLKAGGKTRYLQLIDPATTFSRLQERVAERLSVSSERILGKGQERRVSFARKVLAWLCVQEGLSQAEVGRYLGGRTRASVSYCIKTLERSMAESKEIRTMVEDLL